MDMEMMTLKNSAVFLWDSITTTLGVLWCFIFVRFTLVSLLENVDYESYGGADILGQLITTQRLATIIGLQQKIIEPIQYYFP